MANLAPRKRTTTRTKGHSKRLDGTHGLQTDVLAAQQVKVEGAMGLDVVQLDALSLAKGMHGASLVEDNVVHLLGGQLHWPPSKADEVREARMCAHLDVVLLGQPYGPVNCCGVRGVETSGNVCDVDVRHDALIVGQLPPTKGLAHLCRRTLVPTSPRHPNAYAHRN